MPKRMRLDEILALGELAKQATFEVLREAPLPGPIMSNLYWSGRELADEIEWFCCVRGDKEGDRLKLSVATIRQAKDGRVLDIQFTPEAEALRVNP